MTDEEAIKWADKTLKEPNPATDGGCTFAPDINFKECCKRHDVLRNYNQGVTNRQADRILRKCIKSKGHPLLAWVYWAAVRYESMIGNPIAALVLITAIIAYTILFIYH